MEVIQELEPGYMYPTKEIVVMVKEKKRQKELLTKQITKLEQMKSLNSFKYKRVSLKKRKKSKRRKKSSKKKK
tara:strand:+ start:244 stop:462 length:219 start_codon:yes stop_codon:yes gene_type:complete